MNYSITYLKRASASQYHSIEALFQSIETLVAQQYVVKQRQVAQLGAAPWHLIKNMWGFKVELSSIIHITGDVHYMAMVTGKRTILTVHDIGSALSGFWLKNLYIKLFWFWLPANCVRYITVISEFTKMELVQVIPFAKQKIRVIHNPVGDEFSISHYTFNNKCPVILCMGTKANKNLEVVMDSILGLSCTLHIVGPLTALQKRKLQRLNITYTNSAYLTRGEVVQAYIECDLLCFPSTYEGFGMPIIEAQAIGRPVVTSNLGAMKEVAGNSACLVDPFDTASIKAGIEQIIANAAYREELITKGLENVDRFSLERIAKQYINLYEELMPA